MPDLMVECVNAHARCYGGAGGPCPYCEPVWPLRTEDGRFFGYKLTPEELAAMEVDPDGN